MMRNTVHNFGLTLMKERKKIIKTTTRAHSYTLNRIMSHMIIIIFRERERKGTVVEISHNRILLERKRKRGGLYKE